MKDFMKRNPELAAGAYSSFSKIPISAEVKAKMDKINEAAEGNYKELLNKKIEGTNINKFTKKEAGEIWNKELKGPESNPMEGRWVDTYLEKADNICSCAQLRIAPIPANKSKTGLRLDK